MKRDMDLLREILLKIESDPKMDGRREMYYAEPDQMGISDRSPKEFLYHLHLLISAGLVDGSAAIIPITVRSLTWDGHEFVDNIRNDNVWGKTKKRLAGLAGTVSVGVIAAIAQAETKKLFGLS
jgi:hypothetical protein